MINKSWRIIFILLLCWSGSGQAEEARAYLVRSACPVSEAAPAGPELLAPAAAIGLAIGEKFFGGLIDNGVDALMAALKPDIKTLPFEMNVDGFYSNGRLAPETSCIVLAVGEFSDGAPSGVDFLKGRLGLTADYQLRLNKVLQFSTPPNFYMEAARRTSSDKTAIVWEPKLVYIGDFLSHNIFAGSRRDVAVTIQMLEPGGQEKLAETIFKLPNVQPNSQPPDNMLAKLAGAWSPLAPSGKDEKSGSTRPYTLKVIYVETPKPGQLITLLAGAVQSQSDAIKTAAKESVLPSVRAAAEETAFASAKTDIKAYLTARTQYDQDCTAIAADVDLAKCQLSYVELQQNYNAAAKARDRYAQLGVTLPAVPAPPKKGS